MNNDKFYINKNKFIDQAIDYENGPNFHKNIKRKNTICFFNNNSFVVFKIVNVEGINCCYIKYLYGQDKESLNNVFYGMLNYIINKNVKFIYYAKKQNNIKFYAKYLKSFGFNYEEKTLEYTSKFKCLICGDNPCTCKSDIFYI